MSLVGLDIGTTGCKALLLGRGGAVLAVAYREYPFVQERPGWVELDPGVVWGAVCEVVAEAAAGAGNDRVAALSISSHGESITPVARDGTPLCRTIASLDKRTASMASYWDEFGRERLREITGIPFHHRHSINRLVWLRRHMPDVYQRAWKFLCYEDLVLFKMGLPPAISESLASRTMAFDVARREWSSDVLEYAGVSSGLLADVRPSGTPIGSIPARAAEKLGLEPGVLAVVGGHDQPCAALGAGITTPGGAVDCMGTVEALTTVVPARTEPTRLLSLGYPRYPHVVVSEMVTMGVNPNGGSVFCWYRNNIAEPERKAAMAEGRNPYELIIEQCDKRPSGLFVLPYFAGRGTPSPDPGQSGAFLGLNLATTRQQIAWAILESMAYELRINVEALNGLGLGITRLVAVGGGAGSLDLLRLRAAVLGLPVARTAVGEASCLGAAMLAGVGAGSYADLQEAAQSLVRDVTRVDPDDGLAKTYEEVYRTYLGLRAVVWGTGSANGDGDGASDVGL